MHLGRDPLGGGERRQHRPGRPLSHVVPEGAAEVGGLVEMVEVDAPCDFPWTSVTGVDHRGRWRLRETSGGRTRVEFRLAYVVEGAGLSGWVGERVAAPTVTGHLRRTLQQLERLIEHEQLRARAARRRAGAHG